MYTKAKMHSCSYQLVSVIQYATRCCHLCASSYLKQSELGTGRYSYRFILLVLSLGSLMIDGVSVHCTNFECLVHLLLHMNNLCKHYKYSRNGYTCASSRTRPSFSSHPGWVRGYCSTGFCQKPKMKDWESG